MGPSVFRSVRPSVCRQSSTVQFLLISRRGWKRCGYRFTCRGLDAAGTAHRHQYYAHVVVASMFLLCAEFCFSCLWIFLHASTILYPLRPRIYVFYSYSSFSSTCSMTPTPPLIFPNFSRRAHTHRQRGQLCRDRAAAVGARRQIGRARAHTRRVVPADARLHPAAVGAGMTAALAHHVFDERCIGPSVESKYTVAFSSKTHKSIEVRDRCFLFSSSHANIRTRRIVAFFHLPIESRRQRSSGRPNRS